MAGIPTEISEMRTGNKGAGGILKLYRQSYQTFGTYALGRNNDRIEDCEVKDVSKGRPSVLEGYTEWAGIPRGRYTE